jgi:hypothetical protein
MDRLHWRTLRDNARDNAGDSDTYFAWLGHLGLSNTDRIVSIYIPRLSKESDIAGVFAYKPRQCKYGLSYEGNKVL